MREAAFVKQNIEKWQGFEAQLGKSKKTDADQLAAIFVQLTDDLSFSKTQIDFGIPPSLSHSLASLASLCPSRGVLEPFLLPLSSLWMN